MVVILKMPNCTVEQCDAKQIRTVKGINKLLSNVKEPKSHNSFKTHILGWLVNALSELTKASPELT